MNILLLLTLSAFSIAAETKVAKTAYLTEFKAKSGEVFCADKTYFRQCFEGTAENCKKVMASSVAACASTLEASLPAELTQPQDGQEWGKKIGACAGEKFEQELAKSKKTTADCQDPAKWN